MRSNRNLISLLFACAFPLLANGQNPTAPENPAISTTFKSGAEFVQVPVIVQSSGKHLPGLTKKNFVLQQDGKEQNIATFEEVHSTPAARPARGETFANAFPSGQGSPEITILAIDTVNTPTLDQAYFRVELKKYLSESKSTGSSIGVVELTRSGIRVLHDFTTDHKSLLALVKNRSNQPTKNNEQSPMLADAYNEAQQQAAGGDGTTKEMQFEKDTQNMQLAEDRMSRFQDTSARIDSLFALQQLAQSLKGIPGRKAVLWAGSGFQFVSGITVNSPGGRGFTPERTGSTLDQHLYTWQLLNDANVAVYPIDTRRTVNTAFQVMDTSLKYSPTPQQKDQAREDDSQTLGTFQTLAAQTGGKPCIYRTDLQNCIREAVEDNRDYYLLGFYLDKSNNNPGWHKLNLKLDQKASLRYRSGFIVSKPNPDMARQSDLQLALNSPFSYTALPFAGRFATIAPNGATMKVGYELRIPPESITIEGDHINFDVVAVFRTGGGKEAARLAQRIDRKLLPENVADMKQNGINYKNRVDVPVGEYGVWFVLRDNPSGRTGSVSVPLTVN